MKILLRYYFKLRYLINCNLIIIIMPMLFAMVVACATPSSKLPPPPPKYVHDMSDTVSGPSANSLWADGENLFSDIKARRVNDLVTILIVESLSGSGTADTTTSRDSSVDLELAKFLGMPTDFGVQDRSLFHHLYNIGDSNAAKFDPTIQGSAKSDFKGEGDTNREGTLNATITAKVVEVMPNGNLVLESRKELTINNETQILVLRGIARVEDITSANTLISTKLADAQVYYVGDGVIQEKQSPGWLVRISDHLWPF
jgi:flagellar L-ring protein precursor FlgH